MHDKAIQLELPPWPHIQGERVRVQVSDRRFLFGHLVKGSGKKCETLTVLCDGGQIVQTQDTKAVR